jgi:hypothetical protein
MVSAAMHPQTTNLGVGGSNPSGRATQSPGNQRQILLRAKSRSYLEDDPSNRRVTGATRVGRPAALCGTALLCEKIRVGNSSNNRGGRQS